MGHCRLAAGGWKRDQQVVACLVLYYCSSLSGAGSVNAPWTTGGQRVPDVLCGGGGGSGGWGRGGGGEGGVRWGGEGGGSGETHYPQTP